MSLVRPCSPASRERGFTLVELLVVIIILGLLSAVAVPLYLHQRRVAQDAAAISDLRNLGQSLTLIVISGEIASAESTVSFTQRVYDPATGQMVEVDQGEYTYTTRSSTYFSLLQFRQDGQSWYAVAGSSLTGTSGEVYVPIAPASDGVCLISVVGGACRGEGLSLGDGSHLQATGALVNYDGQEHFLSYDRYANDRLSIADQIQRMAEYYESYPAITQTNWCIDVAIDGGTVDYARYSARDGIAKGKQCSDS